MKKSTLLLLSAALLGGTASASAAEAFMPTLRSQRFETPRMMPKAGSLTVTPKADGTYMLSRAAEADADAKEELSMEWGYCDEAYTAYKFGTGTIKGAIMMTADIATDFAGAELTAIQVANPSDEYELNPVKTVTVWLSENLNEEPFTSATADMGEFGFNYTSVDLPEPYVIKAGTPVYIGFTIDVPEEPATFPIVVDGIYPSTEHSCYIWSLVTGFNDQGKFTYGTSKAWAAMGTGVGSICLTATIKGDMLPTNKVEIYDAVVPAGVPYDAPFDVSMFVFNRAANTIKNFDITLDIDGMESQTVTATLEKPIGYNEYTIVYDAQFKCTSTGGRVPYTLSITAINGTPITPDVDETRTGTLICYENGFKRNVIIEECTGTWCGYCPAGYAGMEMMREKYADDGFLGIAIHQGDRMSVMDNGGAYSAFTQYTQTTGFPSAFINREFDNYLYPSPDEMEYSFLTWRDVPSLVSIEADVTADPENERILNVKTTTEFAEDMTNVNYTIGYTVTKDGVGPYDQVNYYSGGDDATNYGFGSQPNPVSLIYNDVAQNISKPFGVDGITIPSTVQALEKYTNEFTIDLGSSMPLADYHVVFYMINKTTGTLDNGCSVFEPSYNSIKTISESGDTNAPVEFFDIQGRRVANPAAGNLYIVRQGTKVAKVVL